MLDLQGLSHLQLRVWTPDKDTCSIANPEKSPLNLNSIFALATDIVLLSIMVIGFLRLRCRGGGLFALAQLLWKQVSDDYFLGCGPQKSSMIRDSFGYCSPPSPKFRQWYVRLSGFFASPYPMSVNILQSRC